MGFERYVDYALDVPMYFVMRDGKYINTAGESFRAFMDGRLPQLPGEKPVLKDWADHLTTIFPEVRLKQYLEMRGAEFGPLAQALRASRLLGGAALRAVLARCRLGPRQGLDGGGPPGPARRCAETRAPGKNPWTDGSGHCA